MLRKKHHKQTQDTTYLYEEGIYKGINKTSMEIKDTSLLDENPILIRKIVLNKHNYS